MYTALFGLKEKPFNLTPDPRYLFLGPQHRDALNHLIYGIGERKGFIVITGGIGTGKTTISRALLSLLDESVDSALIFNSAISDIDLLATIKQEFGIRPGRGRKSKKRCIDALNTFLLKNFASGKNAVLLIDEAQNLSLGTMEQIRMLSNLETEKEKLLQIVLIGQPELEELLQSPSLKQLNERITVRYEIKPLSQQQVRQYMEHRLAVAGSQNGQVNFLESAYRKIYTYSAGIPRRINAICDRALLIAYTKDIFNIDKYIVKQAAHDLGENYLAAQRTHGRALKINLVFAFILALFCIILLAATVSGTDIFRFLSSLIILK